MLLEAAADLGLSLEETIFIGDTATDIAAGHAAGVGAAILVLSGANRHYAPGDMHPDPDHVFPDLTSAVSWVLFDK
jgi:phosphoglycolate phosphatase-like HAD superfamily hydrolase